MYFTRHIESDSRHSVSTTDTRFFHGLGYLDFIEQHLFPEWDAEVVSGCRARHIRIWSAENSDGEEAYSLAMALLERFPAASGWRIQILATNLLTDTQEADSAPERLEGTISQGEVIEAGSEIGPAIEVRRVRANEAVSPLGAPFDLILCRNVLTCFDYESKVGVRRAVGLFSPARNRSKTRTR